MKFDFNARTASLMSAGASESISGCALAGDGLGAGEGDCASASNKAQQTNAARNAVLRNIKAPILLFCRRQSNITPEAAIIEVNLGHGSVGAITRLADGFGQSGDGENASPRGNNSTMLPFRAGVEDEYIGQLRCTLQTADRLAAFVSC